MSSATSLQTLQEQNSRTIETHQNIIKAQHAESTKPFYMKSVNELKQQLQVENVFINFDDDGSNSLDCKEIFEMFNKYGIKISMKKIQELFKIVDEDGSGSLSLDEFKQFMFSQKANEKFREVIKRLREKKKVSGCVPFSFNVMLEHLSEKVNRQQLHEEIDDCGLDASNVGEACEKFSQLFIDQKESLERGIVQTMSANNKLSIDVTKIQKMIIQDQAINITQQQESFDDVDDYYYKTQPLTLDYIKTEGKQMKHKMSLSTIPSEDSNTQSLLFRKQNEQAYQNKLNLIIKKARIRGQDSAAYEYQQKLLKRHKDKNDNYFRVVTKYYKSKVNSLFPQSKRKVVSQTNVIPSSFAPEKVEYFEIQEYQSNSKGNLKDHTILKRPQTSLPPKQNRAKINEGTNFNNSNSASQFNQTISNLSSNSTALQQTPIIKKTRLKIQSQKIRDLSDDMRNQISVGGSQLGFYETKHVDEAYLTNTKFTNPYKTQSSFLKPPLSNSGLNTQTSSKVTLRKIKEVRLREKELFSKSSTSFQSQMNTTATASNYGNLMLKINQQPQNENVNYRDKLKVKNIEKLSHSSIKLAKQHSKESKVNSRTWILNL
ncbi:ef hand family protein [Stylonychia lemnae]|uniref:Ef hand family protein n=1 Tax=Stylonychia lemnae TaxID=5949 RepID=A0A078AZ77_STYLE|nr:ef hand family protein [Stylonychia lemnae]|eukprot:CDW86118.1 ef hand family protein [Stylonychia lemnae]